MAKFDEEKFRASAKAAGYSDAEIDAELKNTPAPAGAAVPNVVPIADGRETTAAFASEASAKQKQLETEAAKEKKETLEAPTFDWQNAINSPVGYVTGAAALATIGGLGYALGQKKLGGLGIKDRSITRPEIDRTIDIPMETVEKRNVSPFAQQFETTYGVPLSTAEQLTGGPITNPKDAAIIGGALKNQGGISINTPYQATPYSQAPVAPAAPEVAPVVGQAAPAVGQAPAPVAPPAAAPADPLAPRPNPYMATSVQAGVESGNPAPAIQSVIAQEIDQTTGDATSESKTPKKPPAVATFKSAKDIPEGMMFRPDVGNLDRSLGNILGLEHRANAREMLTGGKPFGQFTGAGPQAFNNEISRLTNEYFQRLQSEIPETILSRDARRAQGIPSDFGTFAKTTNFGKAAKVGGVAGTLIAIADAANAAQQGKFGEAAVRSADVATEYVPMIAQLKQGLAPTEASAPGVSKKAIQNAALLGSPYAQTDWAKGERLKEKAGAGRGIAPPSAYMR